MGQSRGAGSGLPDPPGGSCSGGSVAPSWAVPPPGAPACHVFPKDNVWHADISRLPVDPHSAQWLASMSASTTNLHPDFGPSGGFPYGLPYTTVSGSHPKVRIT